MALLTYHSGRRGFLGFLTYLTGSDNVSRGGVIPAHAMVDSTGAEFGTVGNPINVSGSGGGGGVVTQPTASNLNAQVVGNVASAAVDSGNPVKAGGVVLGSGTIASLTNATRTDLTTDSFGNLRTTVSGLLSAVADGGTQIIYTAQNTKPASLGGPLATQGFVWNGTTNAAARGDTNATAVQPAITANFWNYAAASGGISNSAVAVTVKAAAGAAIRNYASAIQISWSALTAGTEVAIRDGAGGTVLWRFAIGTGVAGSRDIEFGTALKGTVNTLMEIVTLTASGTGTVYANLQGWTGA